MKAISVLCVECGKWIYYICTAVKRMTQTFLGNFGCRKCGGILESVNQEEQLCDEEETVREFAYLGDMVSAGGEYEPAMTVRTRCGWLVLMECGGLMYGKRLPLVLNWFVYATSVRLTILCVSEVWCLKENKMRICDREMHRQSNMWSAVQR